MGSGNNLGLKQVKTDFAIILNPDVVLKKDTIQEIIYGSKKLTHIQFLPYLLMRNIQIIKQIKKI